MKLSYPSINKIFDTKIDAVNTLVIENQNMLLTFLNDLYSQLCGFEGKTVISENNSPLSIEKNLELLSQFVPFEINKKNLINKLNSSLVKTALDNCHYSQTLEFITTINSYLNNLSFDLNCDVDFDDIDIHSVIKAINPHFKDSYSNLAEKIIDYFELVTEFDKQKLFITFNIRSFISDEETYLFIETIKSHDYNVIMIENCEHNLLDNESRFIIDNSLCEIS